MSMINEALISLKKREELEIVFKLLATTLMS